ncbi:MAG: His-Xaa-Ser system radical SAM maturase HxsB [Deltaproteobacteria bacterium]|nr:His-Xaa-Ser system radical SAM maturase HxsB [Deltaproteobacteria bacterium]
MTPAARPPRLVAAAPATCAGLRHVGHFRFRRLGSRCLLTTDAGEFGFVTQAELEQLLAGTLPLDAPAREALREMGLLDGGRAAPDTAARIAERKAFLSVGPCLHVLVVTLRCNQRCAYCHASRRPMSTTGVDMTTDVAERAVRVAFQSPAPSLTFEFQGGEPLANLPVVRHAVEVALDLNRSARKRLTFSLVTNLSLMDEDMLAWILDRRLQVCTSLDGPADLHDRIRPLSGGSSHAATVQWMERLNRGYEERGLDPELYHVEALATVTRESLGRGRDIVDEYVRRGLRGLFLRPLNPFGFARRPARRLGYTTDEFLAFYRETLDHVIDLNLRGTDLVERLAGIFLAKILSPTDPNFLDIRSPCGAGIGQIAYGHDGQVFSCDEGRMVHQMGDPIFRLGDLERDGYGDLVESGVVRSLAVASCLEALPGCTDCAYLPYCGTCPVFNYTTQGNIFGRMPDNEKCRLHLGLMDHLFGLLASDDGLDRRRVFERWASSRERPFFRHE